MSGSLDWSIRIVSAAGGTSAFQPRVPGANPGDPLKAQVGDTISWGNDTTVTHQPWPTVGNTQSGAPVASNPAGSPLFFSQPIAAGNSSNPQYVVPGSIPGPTPGSLAVTLTAGSTIFYCCKNHPTERGRIVIF